MSLKAKLARQIAATGPITIADFMIACLHDPEHGYYATRPAIGAQGDFVTSPMVSQMFGELIGLWLADAWIQMGRPGRFQLVEMGPGDGTLMSDVLRAAARAAPDFVSAADLWLVETSAPLRALQAATLAQRAPQWAQSLNNVPKGAPLLLVANELLDCLPVRQFVRTDRGWTERRVGIDADLNLLFGLNPVPSALVPVTMREAPLGEVVEISAAQTQLGYAVGARLRANGGAALFIDYGRDHPDVGDTLQALQHHQKVDVLKTAGEADLTVHADFPAFAAAARAAGAQTTKIVTQAAFLNALGIQARAQALMQARPDLASTTHRQLQRLVASDQMGELFKVVAIHTPGLEPAAF